MDLRSMQVPPRGWLYGSRFHALPLREVPSGRNGGQREGDERCRSVEGHELLTPRSEEELYRLLHGSNCRPLVRRYSLRVGANMPFLDYRLGLHRQQEGHEATSKVINRGRYCITVVRRASFSVTVATV